MIFMSIYCLHTFTGHGEGREGRHKTTDAARIETVETGQILRWMLQLAPY
jgi:hypothetical protein